MELSPELIKFCQRKALGQVLTDWGDLTYEQVIESLEADEQNYPSNPNIIVWQAFENQWAEFIVEQIEDLFIAFKTTALFALDNQGK